MVGEWVVFLALVWVPGVLVALVALSGWLWGPTVGDLREWEGKRDDDSAG